MNKSEEATFKKFIIKYTVIASVITWLISAFLKDFMDELVDNIINPFFSIDLDNDGKPDIQQLNMMVTEFLGHKFPLGKLLLAFIKITIAILVIYLTVIMLYYYTNLLKM